REAGRLRLAAANPDAADPRLGVWTPERAARAPGLAEPGDAPLGPEGAHGAAVSALPVPSFALRAVDDTWISVQSFRPDGSRATFYEGVLSPTEMLALPDDLGPLRLRTGNAGGAVLIVDGRAYGPVGDPGAVLTVSDVTPDGAAAIFAPNAEITQRVADEAALGVYAGPIAEQLGIAPAPEAAPATAETTAAPGSAEDAANAQQ
ncbi:MAG: DUF4115 domain-containing protein, partial [Pseudomonadota bacterium]